uniref:Uncharacterized protein n=1 Tax=Strongyloides venezuelensis TaxID=75913 RepID=A0A0K0FGH3_STRVS
MSKNKTGEGDDTSDMGTNIPYENTSIAEQITLLNMMMTNMRIMHDLLLDRKKNTPIYNSLNLKNFSTKSFYHWHIRFENHMLSLKITENEKKFIHLKILLSNNCLDAIDDAICYEEAIELLQNNFSDQ